MGLNTDYIFYFFYPSFSHISPDLTHFTPIDSFYQLIFVRSYRWFLFFGVTGTFYFCTVLVVIIPFGWRTPDEHEYWCPFYRKTVVAN